MIRELRQYHLRCERCGITLEGSGRTANVEQLRLHFAGEHERCAALPGIVTIEVGKKVRAKYTEYEHNGIRYNKLGVMDTRALPCDHSLPPTAYKREIYSAS